MRLLVSAALAFLLVSFLPAARADENSELQETAERIDGYLFPPEQQPNVVNVISEDTGLPVSVVEEQRARTHLGYGSLLIAKSLARESGRSFNEVVTLKASGHGWGEIAQQYGLAGEKLGPIVRRLHRANELALVKNDTLEHAEKFVNGHDARDGILDGTGKDAGRRGKAGKHLPKIKGDDGDHGHAKGKGHGGGHHRH